MAVELPLGDELAAFGGGAGFPLAEDPRATSRTSIVGMFVLRPARRPWTAPMPSGAWPERDLREIDDWCFNVPGAEGGGTIGAGNAFDAMRLTLQYGLVDAVIVGSGTVLAEGLPQGAVPGHLWQPWGPAAWPQLAPAPELPAMIARVRRDWQALGVLSPRRWPAQILVSQSGARRRDGRDLLEASVFSAVHPDGSPVECRILTSVEGAERLRSRAAAFGLADRMDAMLLPLSPAHAPGQIDVEAVPEALRAQCDIRLANHDGGRSVLARFSEAGALAQLNLTLMRERAVQDLPQLSGRFPPQVGAQAGSAGAPPAPRYELFFSGDHRLPTTLRPMQVLHDGGEAVVVSFDARALRGL